MKRQKEAADAAERNGTGWDEGEVIDREPVGAGPGEPDDGVSLAGDVDLDELDGPIDPDLLDAEGWDLGDVDSDLDLDEVDEDADEVFDDEAEIHLLHDLGIDLDAPDSVDGLDLALDLDQGDPADDGVAA
jgi:hypothetical protein